MKKRRVPVMQSKMESRITRYFSRKRKLSKPEDRNEMAEYCNSRSVSGLYLVYTVK